MKSWNAVYYCKDCKDEFSYPCNETDWNAVPCPDCEQHCLMTLESKNVARARSYVRLQDQLRSVYQELRETFSHRETMELIDKEREEE